MQDMLFRADLNEAILGIAAFVILLLGFMLMVARVERMERRKHLEQRRLDTVVRKEKEVA